MVVDVIVSNSIPVTLSKREMLEWIEGLIPNGIPATESLRSGAAYCLLLKKLFPGSIRLTDRVKLDAIHEYDFVQNFRVVQETLEKLKVSKKLEIERLSKGKGCFEFLQWFKKFFDANFIKCEQNKDGIRIRRQPPQVRGLVGIEGRCCVVCLENKVTHCSGPCGHFSYCKRCAEKLSQLTPRTCAVCRRTNVTLFRVFM